MSDRIPVPEQIMRAVNTLLTGVTFTVNNVSQTTTVARPTLTGGFTPAHNLIILTREDWRDAGDAPMGKVRRILPVTAGILLKPSKGDSTPIEYHESLAAGAIEEALVADRTLGGIAEFLELVTPDSGLSQDGAFWWHGINFEVTYSHAHNDPFTPT